MASSQYKSAGEREDHIQRHCVRDNKMKCVIAAADGKKLTNCRADGAELTLLFFFSWFSTSQRGDGGKLANCELQMQQWQRRLRKSQQERQLQVDKFIFHGDGRRQNATRVQMSKETQQTFHVRDAEMPRICRNVAIYMTAKALEKNL